jgi:hypothetical protein
MTPPPLEYGQGPPRRGRFVIAAFVAFTLSAVAIGGSVRTAMIATGHKLPYMIWLSLACVAICFGSYCLWCTLRRGIEPLWMSGTAIFAALLAFGLSLFLVSSKTHRPVVQ